MAEHAGGLICLTGGEKDRWRTRWRGEERKLASDGCENSAKSSGAKIFTSSCRGTFAARKRRAIRQPSKSRARWTCRCWPRMAFATRTPQQREALDVFTCIRHHRTLATAGHLLTRNSERHLKSPEEMSRLFADFPEAIANTEILSSRLQFTLNDLGYEFPKYPVPDGKTQMHFLRERAYEGMISRYGTENERARKQIERELALIEKLDLPGYFLIVWDIIRFCREQQYSGAGSRLGRQ